LIILIEGNGELMERLQKYMAGCGVASRRKCEEIIASGRVSVNGVVTREMGFKVDPLIDKVMVDNQLINTEEQKVYIILNKPVGIVSTVKDEKDRQTIMDLVKVKERVYPIGRLDYDSSGLIIMTNDGEIYNKIIHPRVEINKVYMAILNGTPNKEEMYRFCNGVKIDDYTTSNAEIEIIKEYQWTCEAKITIHEGKNRQIRKMCEVIDHEVKELERISVGDIKLGELPSGKWRYLREEELNYLKSL